MTAGSTAIGFRAGADPYDWVFLLCTVLLAGVHLYLGLVAGFVPDEYATQFVAIGLTFLAVALAYLSPLWRPVLYPLVVVFAVFLGVLWVLDGMRFFRVGVAVGVVATCFSLLSLRLFVRDAFDRPPT